MLATPGLRAVAGWRALVGRRGFAIALALVSEAVTLFLVPAKPWAFKLLLAVSAGGGRGGLLLQVAISERASAGSGIWLPCRARGRDQYRLLHGPGRNRSLCPRPRSRPGTLLPSARCNRRLSFSGGCCKTPVLRPRPRSGRATFDRGRGAALGVLYPSMKVARCSAEQGISRPGLFALSPLQRATFIFRWMLQDTGVAPLDLDRDEPLSIAILNPADLPHPALCGIARAESDENSLRPRWQIWPPRSKSKIPIFVWSSARATGYGRLLQRS